MRQARDEQAAGPLLASGIATSVAIWFATLLGLWFIVYLFVAILSTMGDNENGPPFEAHRVTLDNGYVLVADSPDAEAPEEATWYARPVAGGEWIALNELAGAPAEPRAADVGTATSVCLASGAGPCFTVDPDHLHVLESSDGTALWETAWEVTEDEARFLAPYYDHMYPTGSGLESHAIAAGPVDGGEVVAVANGRDGVALRGTDGKWVRIGGPGIGSTPPPILGGPPPPHEGVPVAGLWAASAALIALVLAAALCAQREEGFVWDLVLGATYIALAGFFVSVLFSQNPSSGYEPPRAWVFLNPVWLAAAGLGVVLVVAAITLLVDPGAAWWARAFTTALVVGVAVGVVRSLLPHGGWPALGVASVFGALAFAALAPWVRRAPAKRDERWGQTSPEPSTGPTRDPWTADTPLPDR